MPERRLRHRQLNQFPVLERACPRCAQRLPAALQHPEPHHILQQTSRAANAAFIGEVQSAALPR